MALREIYDHPGKRTKSKVWDHFGFHKKNDDQPPIKSNLDLSKAVCRICRKEYKNTGNTTNFQSHIQGEHKLTDTVQSAYSEVKPKMVQKTINNNNMISSSNLGPDRKKNINEALLKLIVGKVLPPSLVENQYFKDFVSMLEPRYKLPTRRVVLRSLGEKKDEVEEKIKAEIQSVEGLAITHDGWTRISTESYNTTTIHYIHDWELRSAVLNTVKLEGSHTAQRLAETLLETKAKWNLPDCIATTDNAANEQKAFEILGWQRFGCYGHRLNLVVKKAMDQREISKILGKSRKLVTLVHTSSSVNDKFMEKQRLLLPESAQGHKLIADVATIWNSSVEMLERVLEQIPALMSVATDDTVSKKARETLQNCILTFDETARAEKVVEILKPFKWATEIVCSETKPTINKVLPMVTKLLRGLEECDSDSAAVRDLTKIMRAQMITRTEVEDVALLGCILNPYTKGFEHMPSMRTRAEELLRTALNSISNVPLIKQEKNDTNQQENDPELPVAPLDEDDPENQSSQLMPDLEEPEKKRIKIKSADTEDWLSDVMCVGESQIDKEDLCVVEIGRYLSVEMKEGDTDTVLAWWKKNELFFPRLAALAKKLLCVQASSVSSERVFSLAGQLVSKKRSRMDCNTVDMFILLNKNIGKFW